jgi:hypothetical protein
MENKQTAVNFLIKEFSDILGPLETKPMQDLLLMDAIKKAKQIDKEQRIQDMSKMQIISDVDFDGDVTFMFNPKEYYNETYGGNK